MKERSISDLFMMILLNDNRSYDDPVTDAKGFNTSGRKEG